MVRSMIAGVAGLRAHQSKMDVIGNNIANVNTWGFKGYSYNFKDSMYTNSINSSGGSVLTGAYGGRNASQVGYGSQLSSISNVFETGAPSPSSRPMDCMIDGTGFFLVGTMVNGSFTNVKDSGLYLSRVGIFSVDENGYLVDDQRSYVYGYALEDGTGIPETPATKSSALFEDIKYTFEKDATDNKTYITIGTFPRVETTATAPNDIANAINDWVTAQTKIGGELEGYTIAIGDYQIANATTGAQNILDLTITYPEPGEHDTDLTTATTKLGVTGKPVVKGSNLIPGVTASYSDQLSTLRIPTDPNTGLPYKLENYSIREDGTVIGVDEQKRVIPIGQVALISVENPNGLEKTDGYYYSIGDNTGDVYDVKPSTGPTGKILGSYLEMANVDLANEFSNLITTQRGFQANSKIITVTDEMLQELVNMKR